MSWAFFCEGQAGGKSFDLLLEPGKSFIPSGWLLGHQLKALQLMAMPQELITPWLTCLDI